jgi:hypothetical protein
MKSLLIHNPEHRKRVLDVAEAYSKLRVAQCNISKDLGRERRDRPSVSEPGLFDGLSERNEQ